MPRDFLADDNQAPVTDNTIAPRDFLADSSPQPQESVGASLLKAPYRVGEDLYRGIAGAIKSIPGYAHAAKTEVPGVINALIDHPGHALGQGVAGLAELGQNVFNTPHDLINYASNRLNLFPKDWNEKVQMGRMPADTQNAINDVFGQPQYPGEALIRGATRNALNIAGGAKAASVLNPMNLTSKGISKSVVNELKDQVESHSDMYNNLWKQADKQGFNKVPFDANVLNPDLQTIKKYYTPKQYKSVEDFTKNPTLENAQRAQSDLGVLRRSIEENARTKPLLSEERNLHDALSNAEKHIEGNMFKDASGNLNQKLANRYQKITNSYRENVVPYKYNPDIQAFLNKELTAKELVQRLNKGEFAAKKGSAHPQFGIRNALLPILGGVGAAGGAKYLYDQAFGNEPPPQ